MPIAIWALAIGAFTICTSEFVIMGLLQNVATDLNITLGESGFLVTSYALGVVLGAPFITPFLIGFDRKKTLIFLMLFFAVGNFACAIASDYESMIALRLITALTQASFFGLGAVVAAQLVTPSHQARAIGAMFMGATLANIFGAPIGTFIGQNFGWRSTFIVIFIIGIIATIAISILVPKITTFTKVDLRKEFSSLLQPNMLKALMITAFGFGGTFTVFTYISPLLTGITQVSETVVPIMLLLFGLGMAVGNPLGARLADKDPIWAIKITLTMLMTSILIVYFSSGSAIAMVFATFIFGAAMFATIPPLQTHVVSQAGQAPVLSSAFNIAAFNLGNAGGAWIGGYAIDNSISIINLPFIAISITGLGLLISLSYKSNRTTKTKLSTS